MKPSVLKHPQHGGQLNVYAQHYGISQALWLDLSTGINPGGYFKSDVPDNVLRDLPHDDDGLQQAASDYYGSDALLMVPGSSWAIQNLPQVLLKHRPSINKVLLPQLGYSEHQQAWLASGVMAEFYSGTPSAAQLKTCDVCVLINPNNPSTHLLSKDTVLNIAQQLQQHSAWLIVDEAFLDTRPCNSVTGENEENTIVLRSLGKFFGLAGLRVGSVIACDSILTHLNSLLPPWALSHPARFIAKHALQDTVWIQQTRLRLQQQANKLAELCEQVLGGQGGDAWRILQTDFFVTVLCESKKMTLECHHQLCEQGIYTRLLDHQCGIRIGLPSDRSQDWQRLEQGLKQVASILKKETTHVDA